MHISYSDLHILRMVVFSLSLSLYFFPQEISDVDNNLFHSLNAGVTEQKKNFALEITKRTFLPQDIH